MEYLYLIFYACLRLRFLGAETNPGSRRPVPDVSKILCRNVRGLARNLGDLTVVSSQYIILWCSESGLRHASRLGVAGSRIRSPSLAVQGQDALGPRNGCLLTRWLRSISPAQI